MLFYLILRTTLRGRYYLHPYFGDGGTKTQDGVTEPPSGLWGRALALLRPCPYLCSSIFPEGPLLALGFAWAKKRRRWKSEISVPCEVNSE